MFAARIYKGTPAGWPGVYNRLVRATENGPYSHAEISFSNGDSASASAMDRGVRFLGAGYAKPAPNFGNGNWDTVPLPIRLEAGCRLYFQQHEGWAYDYRGNVRFVLPWGNRNSPLKKFCSAACLESLGVQEGWRFGVNAAAQVFGWIGAKELVNA
ncbi:hypothetical protein [Polaromonas sp.]|uniref:hypothetical protein n=1 Tax=Polaromonas sp. TaxID=1869339 RepID=UPI003567EEDA